METKYYLICCNYVELNCEYMMFITYFMHFLVIFDTKLKHKTNEFFCRKKRGSDGAHREVYARNDGYLLKTD